MGRPGLSDPHESTTVVETPLLVFHRALRQASHASAWRGKAWNVMSGRVRTALGRSERPHSSPRLRTRPHGHAGAGRARLTARSPPKNAGA